MANQEESRTLKPVYVRNLSDLYVKTDKGYINLKDMLENAECRAEKILPLVAPLELKETYDTKAESSENKRVIYSSISAQPFKICCISMGPGYPDVCIPWPPYKPCPQ